MKCNEITSLSILIPSSPPSSLPFPIPVSHFYSHSYLLLLLFHLLPTPPPLILLHPPPLTQSLLSPPPLLPFYPQIYVIDSADRRRMEETGVELQQLLDEVCVVYVSVCVCGSVYLSVYLWVDVCV